MGVKESYHSQVGRTARSKCVCVARAERGDDRGGGRGAANSEWAGSRVAGVGNALVQAYPATRWSGSPGCKEKEKSLIEEEPCTMCRSRPGEACCLGEALEGCERWSGLYNAPLIPRARCDSRTPGRTLSTRDLRPALRYSHPPWGFPQIP